MKHFHGYQKKRSYFEGWYFKHQGPQGILALIPAFHIDNAGKPYASLQIVTDQQAFMVPFAAEEFSARTDRLSIILGSSYLSPQGVRLHVKTKEVSLCGQISYGTFLPPARDVMGPFRLLPFLQCYHGVLSLGHSLKGEVTLNGKKINFTGGTGYIEKDRGSSFPSTYLWTQSSWTEKGSQKPACVMLSLADIPFSGFHFTGCIAIIRYQGKEYRLATYRGVKILEYTDQEVLIHQGTMVLHVNLVKSAPLPLAAPVCGGMSRTIHESPACQVRYQFFIHREKIFDVLSTQAGFETGSL